MDTSEGQFQELLAHAIARTNRMLSQQTDVFPLGLILRPNGEIDVSVAAYERPGQIPELVRAMRHSLSKRVVELAALATCTVLPESDSTDVVVLLENHENYCAAVHIPRSRDLSKLDADNLRVGDGAVHVFPIVGS